jgi:hypothetical protein
MDWAVKLCPSFDPAVVQAVDAEVYWKMVEFGVQVQKITEPVRSEWFRAFLTDYAKAVSDAMAVNQRHVSGA